MKTSNQYLALCVAGAVVPYSQFVPFLAEHGLDLRLMVQQLFANRISAFFGIDVIMSAVALVVFLRVEWRRAGLKHRWAPIAALLLVGVSLALPLALYLRQLHLESDKQVR